MEQLHECDERVANANAESGSIESEDPDPQDEVMPPPRRLRIEPGVVTVDVVPQRPQERAERGGVLLVPVADVSCPDPLIVRSPHARRQ